jgi:hypothetical protein
VGYTIKYASCPPKYLSPQKPSVGGGRIKKNDRREFN